MSRSTNSAKHTRKILYMLKTTFLFVMSIQVPLPILVTKENKWFVALCPILDIATQGKTEKEVKENMADIINDYLNDPDTQKPSIGLLGKKTK